MAILKSLFENSPYNCDVQDIDVSWLDVGKYSVEKDGVEDGSEGVLEQRPFDGLLQFKSDEELVVLFPNSQRVWPCSCCRVRTTSTGNVTGW